MLLLAAYWENELTGLIAVHTQVVTAAVPAVGPV